MNSANFFDDNYKALFGEVVLEDVYGIRGITLVPDVILDVGANIGVFTHFARDIFPDAKIVSVEPDPDNFGKLAAYTKGENHVLVNKAIGNPGEVMYRCVHQGTMGGNQSYVSNGLGYNIDPQDKAHEATRVESTTLADLVLEHTKPSQKVMLKLDCEAGENALFAHGPSVDALHRIDYIAAEIHRFAQTSEALSLVRETIDRTLANLEKTHDCRWVKDHFLALKR